MVSVRLENVTKIVGGRPLVDDLTLDIKSGELVALFGPPGSGKTTVLRLIAGLDTVTSGKIYIDEQLVNDLSPARREVGMVFQSFALYPTYTVFDNLAFPLRKKGLSQSEIKNRVEGVAQKLGISHLLQKKPAFLSGGEKQRVAIGRAIVKEPKVLLMDEPLTNLDAKLRILVRTEIRRLQQELGITTIVSTPDDQEALSIADKIAVMRQGKLIQYADTPTIYNKPSHLFVAQNIGTPQINIIEAKLLTDGQTPLLDLKFTKVRIPESSLNLKEYVGKDVLVGLRPSEIRVSKNPLGVEQVKVRVEFIEPLGAESIVTLSAGEESLTAVVPPGTPLEIGEEAYMELEGATLHVFDKESGLAIV
ncbi:MAG: ABC transporter ATP-binding protein [Nitrososphaerota archaeon]